MKTFKPSLLFQFHAGAPDFFILGVQTSNQRLHHSLKMSKHGLLYFVVFEVFEGYPTVSPNGIAIIEVRVYKSLIY